MSLSRKKNTSPSIISNSTSTHFITAQLASLEIKEPEKEAKKEKESIIKEEPLETGGFGTVYRGTWNGMEVAIKEMQFTEKYLPLYRKEVEIMQAITHVPNVVHYLTSVDDPTHQMFQIVMEYYSQGDLFNYILGNQPLAWLQRYKIMRDITKGLDGLHHAGILHRDLKIENILLSANLEAKIGDFGCAEKIENIPPAKCDIKLMGTLAGLAPELVLRTATYSKQSDIYGLALLFLDILNWIPKADKDYQSLGEVYVRLSHGARPPLPPTCKPAMAELMKLSWAQDRFMRPSASTIEAKLEELIKAETKKLTT